MYDILIEDRAGIDIQDGIDYYNTESAGLGLKFETAVDKEFLAISKNPFYQIRYKNIRCKLVKKFPYLIHFYVDEAIKTAYVLAVINTSKDPKENWL